MLFSDFTYLLYDFMSGELLADLPFTGVSFSQRLNTPGQWQGSIVLGDPRLGDVLTPTQPGRTALFVDYQGQLVWGGFIQTRSYDNSARPFKINLAAKEFGEYWTMREQALDYTSTWSSSNADPLVIASTVISDAMAVSNSALASGTGFPLDIVTNATPSGDWIEASYPISQRQNVDTIVNQLVSMGYPVGFDLRYDVAYAAGVPAVTLTMANPRLGDVGSASSVTVDQTSALSFTYPEDATGQAMVLYETSAGSGGTEVDVTNPDPLTDGYPLYETTISHTIPTTPDVLNAMANSDMALSSYPAVVPTITYPVNVDPMLGSFNVGDDILWKIPAIALTQAGVEASFDERFPRGLNVEEPYFYFRVVGLDVTVPEAGVATMVLTLNVPPTTTAVAPPL